MISSALDADGEMLRTSASMHFDQSKGTRQHVEIDDTRKLDWPFTLLTINI